MFAKTLSEMSVYRKSISMSKNLFTNGVKEEPKQKKESSDDAERRIVDSHGNVKEIAKGFNYNIYRGNELFYDKASASEASEFLEGLVYDSNTGTFKNENGRTSYKVKLVKKKAKK